MAKLKNCYKCKVELVVGENWTASNAKRRQNICRPCKAAESCEWRKANPEYQREYQQATKEVLAKYQREYYQANKRVIIDRADQWQKDNPGRVSANHRRRKLLKKKQTPSWYCHWMVVEIYEIAAEMGYEVDHIQPLSKGGLHSHENLQLLTPEENRAKGAKEHG